MKFFVYRVGDRLLGNYDANPITGHVIGAFEPGWDGNYYRELIFVSANSPSSPEEYLKYLKSEVVTVDGEFTFNWDEVEIVEFTIGE